MGMQSTSREILLKSVAYHASDGVLHYVFLVGEAEFYFLARIRSIGGIRGVEYTDALERFLMSIMPEDPGISKKFALFRWAVQMEWIFLFQ